MSLLDGPYQRDKIAKIVLQVFIVKPCPQTLGLMSFLTSASLYTLVINVKL